MMNLKSPGSPVLIGTATVGCALLAAAFILGANSCDGGLEAYLVLGLVAIAALLRIPFAARMGRASAAWAFGLAVFGIALWLAGFVLGNFRLMCRLF